MYCFHISERGQLPCGGTVPQPPNVADSTGYGRVHTNAGVRNEKM
jgi:hypothetical protein